MSASLSLFLQIVLFLKPPLLPPPLPSPTPFLLCTSCRVAANIPSRTLTNPQLKELPGCPDSNGRCYMHGWFCTGAFSKTCPARLSLGPSPPRGPEPQTPAPKATAPALPSLRLFQVPASGRFRDRGLRLPASLPHKLGFLLEGTRGKRLRKSKESNA